MRLGVWYLPTILPPSRTVKASQRARESARECRQQRPLRGAKFRADLSCGRRTGRERQRDHRRDPADQRPDPDRAQPILELLLT